MSWTPMAQTIATLLTAALVLAVLAILVRWARRRGRGWFLGGALLIFGIFPDPIYEKVIRVVHEAREEEQEEDESGAPPE